MNRAFCHCMGLLFLAGLWTEDIREKNISTYKVYLFAFCAIGYRLGTDGFSLQELGGCLLPGGILLVIAWITGESVGYGDGMSVMTLGLWLGGWETGMAVSMGILLSGIWGLVCIFRKKREPMPFIPFLILGMEAMLIYA